MNHKGKYLYGFVDFKENLNFDLGPIGIDRHNVYLKQYNDIFMAASDFNMIDFPNLPKETLLRYLTEHQNTLEIIMQKYHIIPLKFGTMIKNPIDIRKILKLGYEQITKSFAELKNKIELDVVALFSNLQTVLAEIGESDDIKNFKQEALTKSEEYLYKAQIAMGKMVKSYLDQKRRFYAEKILNRLNSVVVKHKNHDIRDDSMIANTAFLISEWNKDFFENIIDELDKEFENKVNFRIIGPLPYNSFNTFTICFADFEKIDFARKNLELPEKAALTEIKEAYKKMSIAFHPDRNPEDKSIQAKFEKINKSYQLLIDYCDDEICSFLKEDVKAWIRVKPLEIEN